MSFVSLPLIDMKAVFLARNEISAAALVCGKQAEVG
jgi:hypothetical protein